jgi:hypothetical protein
VLEKVSQLWSSRSPRLDREEPHGGTQVQATRQTSCFHPTREFNGVFHASLVIESGSAITLWSAVDTLPGEAASETKLQLQPDQPAIVGRQEGGEIEYLDPRYTSTRMVPDTGQPVCRSSREPPDVHVSRGHFMLRGTRCGVMLVNGVPRRDGGIRPPMNGTMMLAPQNRCMTPGEEFLIEPATLVRLRLPNGTVVAIQAG